MSQKLGRLPPLLPFLVSFPNIYMTQICVIHSRWFVHSTNIDKALDSSLVPVKSARAIVAKKINDAPVLTEFKCWWL